MRAEFTFEYYVEQAASTVAMLLFYALLVPALAMLLALTMSLGGQGTRSEAHQLAPMRRLRGHQHLSMLLTISCSLVHANPLPKKP